MGIDNTMSEFGQGNPNLHTSQVGGDRESGSRLMANGSGSRFGQSGSEMQEEMRLSNRPMMNTSQIDQTRQVDQGPKGLSKARGDADYIDKANLNVSS